MKEMQVQEFVRRLRKTGCDTDCRYSFFLGAGCSKSSGIPTASELVAQWLPRLKYIKTGNDSDPEKWAAKTFKGFTKEKAGAFYSQIFKALFDNHEDGQKEIERIVEEKEPGFGYGVLAQLLSHPDYGKHFNVVLTTNFDDLVADALYLYSCKKPMVIYHDSLISFVKISSTRPIVIKLHGDAKFDPHNRAEETASLEKGVEDVLKTFLCEAGLIFAGYGGNDNSIAKVIEQLPRSAFPRGIYWVGNNIPDTPLKAHLEKHNVTLVKHLDFDELLLLLREEFKLAHPEKERYEKVYSKYFDTFKKLAEKVEKEDSPAKQELAKAINTAASDFKDWWAVDLEASKYKKSDPEMSDRIYSEGLIKFPNSIELHIVYANFLTDFRKYHDQAEKLYKRALELDPDNVISLGNYAILLKDIRKDYNQAEKLYLKALEIDPDNVINLGNYAIFLKDVRKGYDRAEKFYKRTLELEPNNATYLDNYAIFLKDIRKDYDQAEKFYKRALELEPNNATNLGNYANFLKAIRMDYERAENHYKRALELDPDNANNLGNYAIFLTIIRKDHDQAEKLYKRALELDPDNSTKLGNYAILLTDIRKNHSQAEKFYKRALELDFNHPNNLGGYANILTHIHKDHHQAEKLYKRALELEPDNTTNLGNYANFLTDIRKDHDQAEKFYKRALEIEPDNTNNLASYANFLTDIRKDFNQAEKLYKRALELESDNAINLSNFGQLLLILKRDKEGFALIKKAIGMPGNDTASLECNFYLHAHSKETDAQKEALKKIKELIKSGIRSDGWDLSANVERAIKDGHPEIEFIKVLAKVISAELDAKELDKFEVWTKETE
jgi:Tfp pilus assembly protein PilF